jgi:hypothetical protein
MNLRGKLADGSCRATRGARAQVCRAFARQAMMFKPTKLWSAESFRQAATVGCGSEVGAAAPKPSSQTVAPVPPIEPQSAAGHGAVVLAPRQGERLVYCELPLVLTVKVESGINRTARLRAATGALSKGGRVP